MPARSAPCSATRWACRRRARSRCAWIMRTPRACAPAPASLKYPMSMRRASRARERPDRFAEISTMQHLPQNNLVSPRSAALIAMIAVSVAVRLVIHFSHGAFPYNFTPVEAIALFGGAYFADRRLALLVPLAAMFLADLVIGLHNLIPVIYGCIALTALVGGNLRGRVRALPVAGYAF